MNQLLFIELIGCLVIFVGGVFFHFLYKYMGKKNWMAIISPVNESIWEHLKLSFYPVALFSLFEYLYLAVKPSNFVFGEVSGIYMMILFILFTEDLYPKFTQRNILAVDLIIFFVAIVISQLTSFWIMENFKTIVPDIYMYLVLILQVFIFGLFSFYPPKLPIFMDSVDRKYGIKK